MDIVGNIQIMEKPDWVSWDNIHEVLLRAHEQNRQNGIVMRLPSLPGEAIREMIEGNGKMFVVLDGDKVVGTGAVARKPFKLWCGNGNYAYLCFASILPEYNGRGLYKQLSICIESESRSIGLNRIIFDTHERNTHMIEINSRNGFKKVSYKHCRDHYNVVMVKWLDGCPYSAISCWVGYIWSVVKVKMKMILK